jgi:hypothetical protein
MRSAVEMILNAFLSRQPAEKQERLVHFLPDSEQGRLKMLPSFAAAVRVEGFENGTLLERVHWSWFLPTLKSYSPQEQILFLSSLDETSAKMLAEEIPCKASKTELTNAGRAYLRKLLLDSVIGAHNRLLPIEYLPPSSLNQLLKLSRNQLIDLIDLLSMHDLALEVRQIVETKILKKIYSLLSEAQQKFLKIVRAKHEVMAPAKLGLDRWDGKEESLRQMLHRRGLARLGLALSRQDGSLGWYICHRLDIGRGSVLFKYSEKEGSVALVAAAVRQVEELLGYEL